jgi:hypothetical protein
MSFLTEIWKSTPKMKLTPEAEVLLRMAASESEAIRDKVSDLLIACGLAPFVPPPLTETEKDQLCRLKNNLAEIRKALFISYSTQEKTMSVVTDYFNTVRAAQLALNDWRLWYDSISKEDTEKGPIYGSTIAVLAKIKELPGHAGGYFETKELSPEQAALNKSVGEEIAAEKEKCSKCDRTLDQDPHEFGFRDHSFTPSAVPDVKEEEKCPKCGCSELISPYGGLGWRVCNNCDFDWEKKAAVAESVDAPEKALEEKEVEKSTARKIACVQSIPFSVGDC